MKKIVVLTDFFEPSINAAKYALSLAVQLQSNVLLYYSCVLPTVEPRQEPIASTNGDYAQLKINCEEQLQNLATQLEVLVDQSIARFKPRVEYHAQQGGFSLGIDAFCADRDVILLVLGNHDKDSASLMMENHTREVLDNATLPVLIVPKKVQFKNIHKIAFATDLNVNDLKVLQSLANLARPFNAELLLTNLWESTPDNDCQVQNFLHEVANKINYPHIYYRQLKENSVQEGLLHLAEAVHAVLIVLVHRRKDFLSRLFGHSYSQRLASTTRLPLLVFPYPLDTLPVF